MKDFFHQAAETAAMKAAEKYEGYKGYSEASLSTAADARISTASAAAATSLHGMAWFGWRSWSNGLHPIGDWSHTQCAASLLVIVSERSVSGYCSFPAAFIASQYCSF